MADVRVAPEAQLRAFDGTSTFDAVKTMTAFDAAAASWTGLLAALAPDRRYSSVSLATAANSTQSWDVNGAAELGVYLVTGTTGTFTFEATIDGTNWFACEVFDATADQWVTAQNLTPTTGKTYRVPAAGFKTIRVRTVSTLGATVAFVSIASPTAEVVAAIDVGFAPHSIGYAITSKTAQYTTTQTGTALWTPATGKRIVVTSVQIQAGGTTAGTMQLWYGASADTTYTRGTDLAIFDGEFAPSATLKPGVVQNGTFVADAADRVLRVTTSAAINPLTVTVWGYETV